MSPSQHVLSRQMMRDWEIWNTNIQKSYNHRMLQQFVFHTQQKIPGTSIQGLTLVLAQTMLTCPFCYWNDDYWKFLLVPWLGNPKNKTTSGLVVVTNPKFTCIFNGLKKGPVWPSRTSMKWELMEITSNDKILVSRVYSWFEGWLSNLTWTQVCCRRHGGV